LAEAENPSWKRHLGRISLLPDLVEDFYHGHLHPRPLSGMVGATGIEPVTPTMSM